MLLDCRSAVLDLAFFRADLLSFPSASFSDFFTSGVFLFCSELTSVTFQCGFLGFTLGFAVLAGMTVGLLVH